MTSPAENSASASGGKLRGMACAIAIASVLVIVTMQLAQAQTYHVLHNFTGGADGGAPYDGLSMDRAGNLYGTASYGGSGHGVVFKLTHRGSGWVFNSIYSFAGGSDGEGPLARVIIGPNGTLYGTTYAGGGTSCSGGYGCGTVFNLRPSPNVCRAVSCPWTEMVLYRFQGGSDGANPLLGDVIFDPNGTIYGTTSNGGGVGCGGGGCGTVFALSPAGSGYSEGVLYSFTGMNGDGATPWSGVIRDGAGNLFGTTKMGGPASNGTVFQLSPSGSGWIESVLYTFQAPGDGYWPVGGLMFDASGDLLGTTNSGGVNAGGTAFNMSRMGAETVIYNFVGHLEGGAYGSLVADASGNLYGMTYDDGAFDSGSVFKLTPTVGGWIYTDLHDFSGTDGRCPYGNVLIDAQGNIYGTAGGGGQFGSGVVWEITP